MSDEILKLSKIENSQAEWESKTDLIRRTVAAGASADELELFFHQARRYGLDPLSREIYFVKRQGKGTIQTGIDGLLAIAHRTGQCAGIDDAEFAEKNERGYPSAAKVVVYKMVQGQRCPFGATARWDEYFPGDSQGFQWKRMPHVMLGKCALALALRKAFPADMSGLYVHEEMDQAARVDQAPNEPRNVAEIAALAGFEATVEKHHGRMPTPQEEAEVLAHVRGEISVPGVVRADVPASGEGKDAFGYVPMRWPVAKMFSEPATESQTKMARGKARDRTLDLDELDVVRRLVLAAYGLEDDGTKAGMSLFVDWLINADDETLDRASAAAEAEPRPGVELS